MNTKIKPQNNEENSNYKNITIRMNKEYNRLIDIISATVGKYKFEVIEEAIKEYLEKLNKLKK